ncbi:hypothetical protein EVAR_82340_1 [Eumeta japonica]|uniref:Uncharacterized protein n=1 Tax=Eumeta variegata TaxID=151549 RepID=A0A4C1UB75_EUMVA|nr:hypothetical protein EVAR_82340_1 [Eumeta japonica]
MCIVHVDDKHLPSPSPVHRTDSRDLLRFNANSAAIKCDNVAARAERARTWHAPRPARRQLCAHRGLLNM